MAALDDVLDRVTVDARTHPQPTADLPRSQPPWRRIHTLFTNSVVKCADAVALPAREVRVCPPATRLRQMLHA